MSIATAAVLVSYLSTIAATAFAAWLGWRAERQDHRRTDERITRCVACVAGYVPAWLYGLGVNLATLKSSPATVRPFLPWVPETVTTGMFLLPPMFLLGVAAVTYLKAASSWFVEAIRSSPNP
jgi:hypothetical protein